MRVGMKVHHINLRLNLIVCQVNTNGDIICVNPKNFEYDTALKVDVFQTLTVNPNNLQKGWKTIYD